MAVDGPEVGQASWFTGARFIHLRDGTEAMIWPLLPTDREALREQYEHLSQSSKLHRFLRPVPHLGNAMLEHLVGDVDGVDHVALVLFVFTEEGVDAPAGIARLARYPGHPHEADVAVTVLDEWQGRGVATALLAALMGARPPDVTEIVTEVAADNAASLAMLRRLGPTEVTPDGPGQLHVVVHVAD